MKARAVNITIREAIAGSTIRTDHLKCAMNHMSPKYIREGKVPGPKSEGPWQILWECWLSGVLSYPCFDNNYVVVEEQ